MLKTLRNFVVLLVSSVLCFNAVLADDSTAGEQKSRNAVSESSNASSLDELSNKDLLQRLDQIGSMDARGRRDLLVEIQRRIVKEGPEEFINRRASSTTSSTTQVDAPPRLIDESIVVRTSALQEVPRLKADAVGTKTRTTRPRTSPYGTAFDQK